MLGLNDLLGRGRGAVDDLAQEFQNLYAEHQERLDRFRATREAAEGPRTASLMGDVSTMEISDYGRKRKAGSIQRHNLKLPAAQALAVKHTYRIAGRSPEFIVDKREESPQERYRSETMQKLAWAIVRESDGLQQIAGSAWDASQLGAGCFDVYFDPVKQMPVFRSIDPAGILVIPGVDDPHNFERVYHFWDVPVRSVQMAYAGAEFRGDRILTNKIVSNHREGNGQMVTLVQACDRNRKVRFALGGNVPLAETIHNYGFAPYIVVPNIGPERDIWGWSDYEFSRLLIEYLQVLLSREADVIAAVANGALIEHGTGLPPAMIQQIIREGGVVQSKREGKVEPIAAPDMPAYTSEHTKTIVDLFKMFSFAPDAAWGQGGSLTGADRALQLMPQLELTALKQLNFSSGLQRLYRQAFRLMETQTERAVRYRGVIPTKAGTARAFEPMLLGPGVAPGKFRVPGPTEEFVEVPRSLRDIFDGDYDLRVVYANRIDPDDPTYVVSELSKFRQGAQSLETTLENLGVNVPEDEMRRIENEAGRFPWLNAGMIALTKAQVAATGQGAGGGGDQSAPFDASLDPLATAATGQDAGNEFSVASASLNGDGALYGG